MSKNEKNKQAPGKADDAVSTAANTPSGDVKAVGDTRADAPPPDRSRRAFFWKLWLVIGGIALIEYIVIALDFLRPRSRRPGSDDGAVVVAGPLERFELESVTAFPHGKFYLVRLKDGGFLALSRECTHLGCTVPWDDEKGRFVCPCHSSSFDITGDVLSPPAPRALDLHPVRIENGTVKVDTSTSIKRKSYDAAQVTHA
jgi:cytochrome b6-f complex iron-sulfur subunit